MFSYVGDYVLDPFLGSGTTMKAAIDLNRNSVGIEINPLFLEIIEKKIGYKQTKLLSHATNDMSYEPSNLSLNVFYDNQIDEDTLSKLFHRESLKSNNL
jgi:adenine specific DNA methylase Mod